MVSNRVDIAPSQQSVKAYVDARIPTYEDITGGLEAAWDTTGASELIVKKEGSIVNLIGILYTDRSSALIIVHNTATLLNRLDTMYFNAIEGSRFFDTALLQSMSWEDRLLRLIPVAFRQ